MQCCISMGYMELSDKRFVGWQPKSSYHDGSSFGCSSAPRNDGDQPLPLVQLQQATKMLAMSIITHSLFLRHTIIKISHKGRRLSLNISSQVFFTCASVYHCYCTLCVCQHPATGHSQFTCTSSAMAGNMVYHLSRLRDNYTSTHTQRPSHLQRFFSSRRYTSPQ